AGAPTKAMRKAQFEVERFDGSVNVNPDAHAAAKADGLEVAEDVELKVEPTALEGLARTQYEGSGMFKVEESAEEEMPQVELPLIMPEDVEPPRRPKPPPPPDRKSTRLNSSHVAISYAVFC